MKTKSLMFQGTASDAGKSWVAAGACRYLANQGLKVAPFKAQNMALNSFITTQGAEMGRAQVFQAEAAKVSPDVRMNPVLLKPSSDQDSQVIVLGKVVADMSATKYYEYKVKLKNSILSAYNSLAQENDVMILEGAGSPTEINLNDHDIVNMGMAQMAQAPVILVADIDKGGVFASIYGTIKLLPLADQKRIKGIIINKFRGDKNLLTSGNQMIEKLTGVPVIGVLPMSNIDLDDEDSVALSKKNHIHDPNKPLDIAVIILNRISNFTDFHSLEIQPDVSVRYVYTPQELGQPDLIILPGSKNTNSDLAALRKLGLDRLIIQAHDNGSMVAGICGGYQILGKELLDPNQIESHIQQQPGLGLLDVKTTFNNTKRTTQAKALIQGCLLHGYEIHMGSTTLGRDAQPLGKIIEINGQKQNRLDGAINADQSVWGTYLHGIFDNQDWTRQLLNKLRQHQGLAPLTASQLSIEEYKEIQYEKLAQLFSDNIDLKKFWEILDASQQ